MLPFKPLTLCCAGIDGIVLKRVKADRGQFRSRDRSERAIAKKRQHQAALFPQQSQLLKTVKPVSGTAFKSYILMWYSLLV